jgi:hypothetical protein
MQAGRLSRPRPCKPCLQRQRGDLSRFYAPRPRAATTTLPASSHTGCR